MASANNASRVTRDRPKTEQGILDAAKAVLAETGFSAFGVNAIARRAGCDKQLIYRYFGGLDGLIDAIALDLADLFRDAMGDDPAQAFPTYEALIEHLLLSLLDAFLASDLLLRVAAWEVFDPTPVTIRLSHQRGAALAAWVEARRGALLPPPGVDAAAINASLIASVQHLVLSARAVGSFAGIPLETRADWDRIRVVLRIMVHSSYAAAARPQGH
jgi:AcrR family transcriptional regulator